MIRTVLVISSSKFALDNLEMSTIAKSKIRNKKNFNSGIMNEQ